MIEKIAKKCDQPISCVKELLTQMERVSIKRDTILVYPDSLDSYFYLVEEGIWRAFCLQANSENTLWFATSGSAAFSVWGYVMKKRSPITIESVTDSIAYRIARQDLNALCLHSIQLANLVRKIFEIHAFEVENDLLLFSSFHSASERYLELITKYPELIQNVPLKKLASYLLITPQSLSRIRRNLK